MSDEKPMIFRAVEEFQAMATEVVALRSHAARLEGEVERLKSEVEKMGVEADEFEDSYYKIKSRARSEFARADAAESRAARLEERLGVARAVLKSVEWSARLEGSAVPGAVACPLCAGAYLVHAPDCALAAALGEGA